MIVVWGLVAVAVAGVVFVLIAVPLGRGDHALAAGEDASAPSSRLDQRTAHTARPGEMRTAIRELELDYRSGKLAAGDYHLLRAQYAREALALAVSEATDIEAEAGALAGNGKADDGALADAAVLERNEQRKQEQSARRRLGPALGRRPRGSSIGAALLGLTTVVVAAAFAGHLLLGSAASVPTSAADSSKAPASAGSAPHDEVSGESTVSGRVTNGTTGAPAPGQDVVLSAHSDTGEATERTTTTDADGRFEFAGLPRAGFTYELAAGYQHVAYRIGAFHLSDLKAPVEMRIYEPTQQDPGLHVSRALLVLGGIDAAHQQIGAHELLTLANPSSQTYVPGKDSGPMGLLRFALPPGAHDLTPTIGLESTQMLQVDRGFASLAAVPPGERDYGFAYYFPYQPHTYQFSLVLPYGADTLRVLAPLGGPEIRSPRLTPADTVTLDGERYRSWSGGGFGAGDELPLEVAGLPARPLWVTIAGFVARPWAAAAGFVGALLMAVGWAIRPRPVGFKNTQPTGARTTRGSHRRARARTAWTAGEARR